MKAVRSDFLASLTRLTHRLDAMYPTLCVVTADTHEAARGLILRRRVDGKSYYSFSFDVIILFGRTELKAQISWKENVRFSGC